MQQAKTIVSLEPAASEWLAALDVSYAELPGSEALRDFSTSPDLVVAPKSDEEAVRDALAAGASEAELLIFEARTIKQVLDAVLQLARSAGRLREAMSLIGDGEARLQRLRTAIGTSPAHQPGVVILTGLDPIELAEGWVRDAIDFAGGRSVTSLDEADAVVVALPDTGVEESRDRVAATGPLGVTCDRVWVIDGSRYGMRPGPALYRTIELVAVALHGRRLGIDVAEDEMCPIAMGVPSG